MYVVVGPSRLDDDILQVHIEVVKIRLIILLSETTFFLLSAPFFLTEKLNEKKKWGLKRQKKSFPLQVVSFTVAQGSGPGVSI